MDDNFFGKPCQTLPNGTGRSARRNKLSGRPHPWRRSPDLPCRYSYRHRLPPTPALANPSKRNKPNFSEPSWNQWFWGQPRPSPDTHGGAPHVLLSLSPRDTAHETRDTILPPDPPCRYSHRHRLPPLALAKPEQTKQTQSRRTPVESSAWQQTNRAVTVRERSTLLRHPLSLIPWPSWPRLDRAVRLGDS